MIFLLLFSLKALVGLRRFCLRNRWTLVISPVGGKSRLIAGGKRERIKDMKLFDTGIYKKYFRTHCFFHWLIRLGGRKSHKNRVPLRPNKVIPILNFSCSLWYGKGSLSLLSLLMFIYLFTRYQHPIKRHYNCCMCFLRLFSAGPVLM